MSTKPLAVWLFNEADTGTGPANALDSTPNGVPLALTYGTAAAYQSDSNGRGFYNGTSGGSGTSGGLSAALTGSKFISQLSGSASPIHGSTVQTLELVVDSDATATTDVNGGVIFESGVKTDFSVNGLGLYIDTTNPTGTWSVWSDIASITNPIVRLTGTAAKVVVHVVVDTAQATAANRIVVYFNGVAQTLTSVTTIPQNSTFTVDSTRCIIACKAPDGSAFGTNTLIRYAAIYSAALGAAEVAANAKALAVNDDITPSAEVKGYGPAPLIPGRFNRKIPPFWPPSTSPHITTAAPQAPNLVLAGTIAITIDSTTTAASAVGVALGSSAITVGQSGALTAAGTLAESNGITVGQSGAATDAGVLTATAAIAIGQSGALGASGALAGSTAITTGQSGLAAAAGALLGTDGLAINVTAALQGTAAQGFLKPVAPPPGQWQRLIPPFWPPSQVPGMSTLGLPALGGSAAIALGQSGALTDAGVALGSIPCTVGQSGSLSDAGVLVCTTAITVGQSGAAAASGAPQGTAAVTFGQSAASTAAGAPACNNGLVLGGSGSPIDAGVCAGSSAILIGGTFVSTAAGVLTGSTAITTGQSGNGPAAGVLIGSSSITFTAVGTINATATGGTAAFLIDGSGALADAGVALGSTAIAVGSATATTAAGALSCTAAVTITAASPATATGALVGSAAVSFTGTATLSSNGGIGSITINASAVALGAASPVGADGLTITAHATLVAIAPGYHPAPRGRRSPTRSIAAINRRSTPRSP